VHSVQANAVSTGLEHSLALVDSGKLYAWGSNEDGQLGTGVHNNSFNPIPVSVGQGTSHYITSVVTACVL